MNALSVGHMAGQALHGFSPWIIAVVAVAAKRTCDRASRTLRGGGPAKRAHDPASAEPEPPVPSRLLIRKRFRARLGARPWSG